MLVSVHLNSGLQAAEGFSAAHSCIKCRVTDINKYMMRPNWFSIEALPYFVSDVIWNHSVSSDEGAGPAHTHNKNGFKRKRERLSASVLEVLSLTRENQPPGGVSDSLGSSAAVQFYKQTFM